ncbi:YheC/YheD family protein [Paenibacillus chondroitinus]|uniref:YheC/YheD family protein n=1 Tax=Paenibacillus chondroitinus TaxID=59842 RepID=A0ABU6DHN8_9BACL|nr:MULTISPECIES: YheC/YheD family protein [Paenibacillus]MCY9663259.1 YheC/YheD family protein [Paenibacillus anseongense]MEB4797056.1 YheC/YheD family protein [Paenibacillus chondroitinus]
MRLSTKRPLLGIMVTELKRELPFASSGFYKHLTYYGAREGLDVVVFSPNRIDWKGRTVQGYTYLTDKKEWVAKLVPLPSLIYDRCFFSNKRSYEQYQYHVRKLRESPLIRFLGYGLGGKWEVDQILQKDLMISRYLPETNLLTSGNVLRNWLQTREDVFLKPQGGSQGKGALHLHKVNTMNGKSTYHIKGRNAQNGLVDHEFHDFYSCWQWLRSCIGTRPYLMQEYLHLHSSEGMAYDIRSLVQKNGSGIWESTGMAVRVGKPGSVTSNLHGGGSAEEVSAFLTREFGDTKASELIATLTMLSNRIPPLLETHHGRLAELGIDLGIDTWGRVWILEVNSKPGRTIFARMRNEKARLKSIANPIYYAGYLLHKKLS